MAAEKNFTSATTGVQITEAQYIVELILRKFAKWKHIDTNGKFWSRLPFKRMWPQQAVLAAKLLKQYSARAIIQAINSSQAERIFSLGNPDLIQILKTFAAKPDIVSTETEVADAVSKPRSESFGKKGSLSRLKDLE